MENAELKTVAAKFNRRIEAHKKVAHMGKDLRARLDGAIKEGASDVDLRGHVRLSGEEIAVLRLLSEEA